VGGGRRYEQSAKRRSRSNRRTRCVEGEKLTKNDKSSHGSAHGDQGGVVRETGGSRSSHLVVLKGDKERRRKTRNRSSQRGSTFQRALGELMTELGSLRSTGNKRKGTCLVDSSTHYDSSVEFEPGQSEVENRPSDVVVEDVLERRGQKEEGRAVEAVSFRLELLHLLDEKPLRAATREETKNERGNRRAR